MRYLRGSVVVPTGMPVEMKPYSLAMGPLDQSVAGLILKSPLNCTPPGEKVNVFQRVTISGKVKNFQLEYSRMLMLIATCDRWKIPH